jgi:hypothetical protein
MARSARSRRRLLTRWSGEDVTIALGAADLWSTAANQLEEVFRKLQPATLVMPERPGKLDRWTIAGAGTPPPRRHWCGGV